MKPYLHAKSSSRKYKIPVELSLPIHDFMDSSKMCFADVRHRAIYHHSAGIFLMEKIFGHNLQTQDGRLISVRDIAEDHVIEDLGFIPDPSRYLEAMKLEPWMGGPIRRTRILDYSEILD